MTASLFVAAAASYHVEIRALLGLVALRVDGTIDLEASLKGEIERAGNTLAAYIGELEDRLTRGSPPGVGSP